MFITEEILIIYFDFTIWRESDTTLCGLLDCTLRKKKSTRIDFWYKSDIYHKFDGKQIVSELSGVRNAIQKRRRGHLEMYTSIKRILNVYQGLDLS